MAGEGFLAAALVVLLAVAWRQSNRKAPAGPASDPPEPFYRPFTTDFDRECRGEAVAALLSRDGKDVRVGSLAGAASPAERRRQFEEGYAAASVAAFPTADLSGTAICILVDQSGSMAARMPRLAGDLLAACEHLEAAGADTMLAGFTTVGWRGGQSRALWESAGRPRYPGRLCDLLHIIYADFNEASTPGLLAPLLSPGIFFENVDGEAVLWAESRLLALPRERRCLIVVSDGAPVDDSSLHENGPNFLWNHLTEVLAGLRMRGQIALGAVGIDHDVTSLYPSARMVGAGGGLAAAIIGLAAELRA